MTVTLTSARRFGVEIECYAGGQSLETVSRTIHDVTGLPTEAYGWTRHGVAERGHNRGSWKVTTDGSLGYSGIEVVSPILSGPDGAAQLTAVMAALRGMGARVNRSCGLHVHHDANDLTTEALVGVMAAHGARTNLMDRMLPVSRRHSQWATHMSSGERTAIERALRSGRLGARHGSSPVTRYRSLNLASYAAYGTCEWRQHQGTLNATKALAWVAMGQSVMDGAAAAANAGTDLLLATDAAYLNEAVEAGLMHQSAARHLARRIEANGFEAVAVTARYSGTVTTLNGARRQRVAAVSPEVDEQAWRCRTEQGMTWREVAERLNLGHESSARTAAGRYSARVGGDRVGYVPAGVTLPVDPF